MDDGTLKRIALEVILSDYDGTPEETFGNVIAGVKSYTYAPWEPLEDLPEVDLSNLLDAIYVALKEVDDGWS